MSRSGQLFTSDFVISAFVFIILLNLAVFTWNMAYDRQDRFTEEDLMQRKAFHITSILVRTPGYPDDWTTSTVELIGLAEPDHVIQDAKVDEAAALDYDRMRALMDTIPFHVHITLNATGYVRTLGNAPPAEPEDLVVERRAVLVENGTTTRGTVEVVLWQ